MYLFEHHFLVRFDSLWIFFVSFLLYIFLFCILFCISFFKYFLLHSFYLIKYSNNKFNFALINFSSLILINLVFDFQLKSLWDFSLSYLIYEISFAVDQVVNSIFKNQLNCLVWKSHHVKFVFCLVWYLFYMKRNLSRVKSGFKKQLFLFKFKCVWRLLLNRFKFSFAV